MSPQGNVAGCSLLTASNRELTTSEGSRFAHHSGDKVFPHGMKFSLGLSCAHMPQGFWLRASVVLSLAHTEVPEDDVQDLLSVPSTSDAGQVATGESQRLSSQG